MKKIMLLFIFLLIPFAHAISLNEIFPNPLGDDNNKEYVEIYTEGRVNLSSYIIGDEASNDTLVELQYVNSSYSLIVEEGFDYNDINASIYGVGATIGNNLGNSNDTVFFYSPTKIFLDSFHYTSAPEAQSYERTNNGWGLTSIGSPGYANKKPNNDTNNTTENTNTPFINKTQVNIIKITSVLPTTVYLNQTITTAFRIDNLYNEKVDVQLYSWIIFNEIVINNETRLFYNISRYKTSDTAKLFFSEPGNYTLCGTVKSNLFEEDFSDNSICTSFIIVDASTISCDRSIDIKINNTIVTNNKPFSFAIIMNDNEDIPYIISYYIQEFNGKIAKEPQNTTNDNIKHWTPKIKKEYGLFTLYAELLEPGCNDAQQNNNIISQYIIVKNTFTEESSISINHIYLGTDGVAKTGDIVRSKIDLYTGNLSQYSSSIIKAYIEDEKNNVVSETTTLTLEENFQELELTIPVILDYSCDSFPTTKLEYTFIIEGIGVRTKQKFPVLGVNKERCNNLDTEEYHSIEIPTTAQVNDIITNKIIVHNTDNIAHVYTISSKIYRGPKTYSGDFFVNQQKIELQPGKEQSILLENTIPDLTGGIYKVKIYVQKDEQKTLKQFTQDILIFNNERIAEEEHESAKIISFFSLSSEPDQQIPVIAQIQGIGKYTLLLDTMTDRQNTTIFLNGTKTVMLNITLLHGKNMLMLNLFSGEILIESRPLILFADEEELNEITVNTTIPSTTSAFEKITGHVVLEPVQGLHQSYDNATLLIVIFIATLIVISVYALYKKKHKLFKRTVLPEEYEEHH
ncbi:MAG: hypothetical protein WC254_05845 [Candidatus Woesearchaeota archaeon]|jgi:hypothetical protein